MAKIKLVTKIGLFAAALAGLTTWYWVHLTEQVALPNEATGVAWSFIVLAVWGGWGGFQRHGW